MTTVNPERLPGSVLAQRGSLAHHGAHRFQSARIGHGLLIRHDVSSPVGQFLDRAVHVAPAIWRDLRGVLLVGVLLGLLGCARV